MFNNPFFVVKTKNLVEKGKKELEFKVFPKDKRAIQPAYFRKVPERTKLVKRAIQPVF